MYSTSLSQKKSDGTTGPLKHLLDLRAVDIFLTALYKKIFFFFQKMPPGYISPIYGFDQDAFMLTTSLPFCTNRSIVIIPHPCIPNNHKEKEVEVYYVYKDAPDSLITADKLLTSSM